MKKIFFVILILTINQTFGQVLYSSIKNECEFFNYLNVIKASNYNNDSYRKLLENENEKFNFLRKLETYLVVFAKDSIAPMFLDTDKNEQKQINSFIEEHSYYCPEYVNEYYKLKKVIGIRKARDSVQSGKYENIKDLLLNLTDLNKNSNSQVEKNLAEFEQSFTLQYLYSCIKDTEEKLPKLVIEQNKKLLTERIDKLGQKIYTYYKNYNSKPDMLKGYEMYHENDVLLLTGMNQDREMTGAFKFSFLTDYFKCRWLPIGNTRQTQQHILTYQTISIGGSGYTPYIRYRNNFQLADSLHQFDRPFCSYIYLERAKNRVWLKGLVRQKGEFQAGMLGTNGNQIQAQLHEDVNIEAQHVYGWDKQIAEEGRLFLQVNQKWDFLLFSSTNKYAYAFRPNYIRVEDPKKKYSGVNISSEFDLRYGTLMTAAGVGIRFSTLNFLQQSGHQMIASRKPNGKNNYGWKFDAGLSYRYVVHNSTLEGLGLTKKFPDDPYDIVKPDDYVLPQTQINRNLIIFDFGINLKWRKTTFFYRQLFHTLEYNSALSSVDYSKLEYLVDSDDKEYYYNTIAKEQNDFLNYKIGKMQYYGYGTIGMNWIID